MIESLDILIKARELIKDPKHWCQGSSAKTATGHSVSGGAPEACQWCLDGAVFKEANTPKYKKDGFECSDAYGQTTEILYKKSLKLEGYRSYISLNDNFTHDKVIAFLDKVIEELTRELQEQVQPCFDCDGSYAEVVVDWVSDLLGGEQVTTKDVVVLKCRNCGDAIMGPDACEQIEANIEREHPGYFKRRTL